MQEQEYRKRNKRVRYESKKKSEQENEYFEQNYRGDYLDSNDSNEQKYSSGEGEEVGRMETSQNSVKKHQKKKNKNKANKNNTKKARKM